MSPSGDGGRPIAIGQEIPALRRRVTREDIAAYADVSGDRNPLHLDDDAAIAAGFPGVIGHGMLTLGFLAAALAAWIGERGDLASLRAQFRSPVYPGDEVVVRARVVDLDDASRAVRLEAWVEVDRDGTVEMPVRRGEALVRLRGPAGT